MPSPATVVTAPYHRHRADLIVAAIAPKLRTEPSQFVPTPFAVDTPTGGFSVRQVTVQHDHGGGYTYGSPSALVWNHAIVLSSLDGPLIDEGLRPATPNELAAFGHVARSVAKAFQDALEVPGASL